MIPFKSLDIMSDDLDKFHEGTEINRFFLPRRSNTLYTDIIRWDIIAVH